MRSDFIYKNRFNKDAINAQISKQLNQSKSAITNEIKRCFIGAYNYLNDCCKALGNASNRKDVKTKMATHKQLANSFESKLKLHWPPKEVFE